MSTNKSPAIADSVCRSSSHRTRDRVSFEALARLAGLALVVLAFALPLEAATGYTVVDADFGVVDRDGRLGADREAQVAADVERQALIAEQAPVYHHVRARGVLGEGRVRDLDSARFALSVSEGDPLLRRSLEDDTFLFEETRDTLLSTFLKLQRESVAQAVGFGEWDNRRRERRETKKAAKAAEKGRWSMRFSPRVDLGSNESVGVKVRMPYTGLRVFESLSFRSRYDIGDGTQSYYLKFDDGDRFVFLGYSQDDETLTDQIDLSVRIWF